MSTRVKGKLIRYGITTAIGLGLMALVLSAQGYGQAVSLVEKYRILCDAFTVPGAMLLLTGALVMVSNAGAFDGIAYAAKVIGHRIATFGRGRDATYHDYMEEVRSRKRAAGFGFIPVTGLAFMAAALVFLALFYHAS